MCFFHITVVAPVIFIYNPESTTVRLIQENFPEMALFQSQNIYFQAPKTKLIEYYCLNIIICYSIYYFLGATSYITFVLKIVKYIKITHPKELVKLQIMFFRMITFQGIVEIVLVITPAYAMGLAFYFQIAFVNHIAILATTACSLQAWLNYISIMYNIVPYRNTIKEWFRFLNVNGKHNCVNVNSISVTYVPPASYSLSR